ncbi:spore germination protein [Gorillibacterium sp. sgz5001074]|uniref:spore germination protein n=1 Tax=Gorillibacterium sp. sgz5001074 TaxID=3446695 RepID=UPI003F671347
MVWKTQVLSHLEPPSPEEDPAGAPEKPIPVAGDLTANHRLLEELLGKPEGLLYRRLLIGGEGGLPALLVSLSGIVDKKLLNEHVLAPLMRVETAGSHSRLLAHLQESVLTVSNLSEEADLHRIVNAILQGCAALFVEGEDTALVIGAESWKGRSIQQPLTETVIRGPRDSFVEDLETNLSLLRKRINHPKLRSEQLRIGYMTRTRVVLVYLEGIVNDGVVKEVRRRIRAIRTDAILESGYIEQYIEDAPFSLFPTIANTEKPDIAAARILEGRVAVFVDGTPIVLTMPDLLISHFQVSEDYYSRPYYASMIRLLRILSFFTTIMLPGLFLAIQYHHPILIPYSLLVSLAKAREGMPFQLYLEVLLMILVFEVIREAGIRMPKPIGQAVSIVGALILGQAAVEAGLVGLPVVVVVAFAGVSTFLIHTLVEPISILRICFAVAGAALGIYGMLLCGMLVVTHLATLRSFGVPYSAPLFPMRWPDWKDTILRLPLWMLWRRPVSLQPERSTRQQEGGMAGGPRRVRK